MKITKKEQSCLVVQRDGDTLVIDPGSETTGIESLRGVVAVVITHEHADHFSLGRLTALAARNPGLRVFAPNSVAQEAAAFNARAVRAGDRIRIASFALEFFGGKHALIHETIPVIDNIAVLVNDDLYHAGDSFTLPTGATVGTLAVPVGAPWMRIGNAMDFVTAVRPKRTIPTHELTLSPLGIANSNDRLTEAAKSIGATHLALEPGQSITV